MQEERFQSLGFLLERAWWATIDVLNQKLSEAGIDLQHAQYTIIRMLLAHDGICQRDLARMLHRDAAGIKRSLDVLEQKGFVERRALSGSKNGVFLTQKSQVLRTQLEEIAEAIPQIVCADMSAEMYHSGMAFLHHLYDSNNK